METPKTPVYVSHVNSSYVGSSLLSHRQSYIGLVFNSHFIDLIINNKKTLVFSFYRFIINKKLSRFIINKKETGGNQNRDKEELTEVKMSGV